MEIKMIKKKKIDNNNKKYISPFPVPGYSLDENLWDFVVDLNEKDPLDENLDEDLVIKHSENKGNFSIKHIIKKKKKKKKKKKNKEETKE